MLHRDTCQNYLFTGGFGLYKVRFFWGLAALMLNSALCLVDFVSAFYYNFNTETVFFLTSLDK